MNNLRNDFEMSVKVMAEGIRGEGLYCEIAQGKFELKKKLRFNILKWTLNLVLPILIVSYIIYKLAA